MSTSHTAPAPDSRLSRMLGYADGRKLHSYLCPEGIYARYRSRLVQKNVDGRDLYAVLPCLPGSSSGSIEAAALAALGGQDPSSSGYDALYNGRLIQKGVEGRDLYVLENPCCPDLSFSSESRSSASRSSSSSSGSSSSKSSSSSSQSSSSSSGSSSSSSGSSISQSSSSSSASSSSQSSSASASSASRSVSRSVASSSSSAPSLSVRSAPSGSGGQSQGTLGSVECCPGVTFPAVLLATITNLSGCPCLDGVEVTINYSYESNPTTITHLWSGVAVTACGVVCIALQCRGTRVNPSDPFVFSWGLGNCTGDCVFATDPDQPLIESCDPIFFSRVFLVFGCCSGTIQVVVTPG